MTAENCTATVNVVGIGTFTCEHAHHPADLHEATLPSDGTWAMVLWRADIANVAPPGSHRWDA